jgi:hypothetical protein
MQEMTTEYFHDDEPLQDQCYISSRADKKAALFPLVAVFRQFAGVKQTSQMDGSISDNDPKPTPCREVLVLV